MAIWLIVTILSYLLFALAFLGDKLVLSSAPKPRVYAFYAVLLNFVVFLLLPFISFKIPSPIAFLWIIADAFVYIASLYSMFWVLERYEATKVMTTIGALQPVMVLLFTWIFWGFSSLTGFQLLSFLLLLAGTIIISVEKSVLQTAVYIKATILPAIFFSLDFIFQKLVYGEMDFVTGLFWMRGVSFFMVLLLLLSNSWRKDIFAKKEKNPARNGKIQTLFVGSQALGGLGGLLQSLAIFLALPAFLPIINSLRGLQYIFLFVIALFLSFVFPKILKEETGRSTVLRKIFSIVLIVAGLAIVAV